MFLLYPTFIDYKQLRKTIDLPVLGSIGLHMGPEQRRHRHRQLTKYLLAMMLLFAIFGSVLWYEEPGSTLVRTLISGSGISL
jgi:hypothetical protein